jgi:uncharacterized protein
MKLTCPTCRKKFEMASSQSKPFCSPRCRQIDLNRWLSEEQRLPVDPLGEEPDEEQSSGPPDSVN